MKTFYKALVGVVIWILVGVGGIKYSPTAVQQTTPPEFTCPEDFGYFPHPTDCSQYYVCVFGGALLESCTGGLMYSNELQTCDWPRNVNQNYCNATQPLENRQSSRSRTRSTTTPPTPYVYKPIKIENYGDLGSVIASRNNNEQEEGIRSGRSYAQSGPEVKEYVGKTLITGRPKKPPWTGQKKTTKTRRKRQILFSILDKLGLMKKIKSNVPQNFYKEAYRGPNSLYPAHFYGPTFSSIAHPKFLTTKSPVSINFKSRPKLLMDGEHFKLMIKTTVKPVMLNKPIVLKSSLLPKINSFRPFPLVSKPKNTTYDYYTGHTLTKQPDRSVSGSSKYTPAQPDFNTDYAYSNQRYAAHIPANNTTFTPDEEDDESYYVYEDAVNNSDVDVDYKTYPPQPHPPPHPRTTTFRPTPTTTRRPSTTPKQKRPSPTSSTRSRPTLKPKSQVVKDVTPVRDVYLDAPSRPLPFYETPIPNTPATKCKRDVCQIPDCNCGGKEIPSGLAPEETPQMVLLTFDDSVNDLNKNLYKDLFEKGRKNPNGCPISATFYVSHEWTDYSQVQNLAADGHEIASHSVSHSFGESFSQKKWEKEINGQREILSAYGGVKLSEIRGMRAPFLAIGGNNMFKMLHDVNFTYDSSMPVYENRPPSWPYTLDYKIFHDCMIPPCPTKSYPGVWEVPMVMWQDLKGGRCSMGDACSNPPTAEGVYQMLAKNFERHYTTTRAPFGMYYHAAWFTQAHHKEGFEAFLDTLVQMDDVWLVTNWQALEWIRNPTSNSRINSFAPWNECRTREHRPERCNHSRVCNLWHKSGVRYMKTCQTCPEQYPWTGNTGVPFTI